MKRLFALSTLVASVGLLAMTVAALGSPVAYDGFESYTAGGSISGGDGGIGWFGNWDTNDTRDAEISVISGGLSYDAGEISISGGSLAVQYVATEDSVADALLSRRAPGMGDTIYMSFLYQTQNLPDGFEPQDPFMQIGLNPTLTNPQMSVCDSHQLLDPPTNSNWWLRAAGGGVGNDMFPGVASPDNVTHLVVMKATRNAESGIYDHLELFINPTSLTETENVSYVNDTSTGLTSFDAGTYFVVRKAFTNPDNTYTFDEIRIAETFTDAVSPVEADTRTRITTADGNGADTFVHWYSSTSAPADCNMGGKTTMEIKSAGEEGGDQLYRKSYLRFDLGDIDVSKLSDVALELTTATASLGQTFKVYGLNDGHAGENWEEGTSDGFLNVVTDTDPSNDNWITWNNAPGNAAGSDADPEETTFLGTFGGDLNGRKVGISGTDLVDFLKADTDGLVTLIISRETHNPVYTSASDYFASSENNPILCPALLLEMNETPKIAGDANNDGKVDGSDVTILAGNWQAGVGAPNPDTVTWEMGDFNGDGQVDGSDVTILAGNWQYGVDAAAAAVPEPSTLLLLVGMIGSLLLVRRK